jgi:hypothetical protein
VNGLNLTGDEGDLTDICNQMKTVEADIICLAETHLDTLYRPTNNIVRQTLQKNYKDIHYCHQFASSNITYNTIHKRGGVGLLTVGPIVGRVIEKGADDLGRWTWQSLTAKTGKVVAVCCYQV